MAHSAEPEPTLTSLEAKPGLEIQPVKVLAWLCLGQPLKNPSSAADRIPLPGFFQQSNDVGPKNLGNALIPGHRTGHGKVEPVVPSEEKVVDCADAVRFAGDLDLTSR